jgi:hypothetical protein
MVKSMSDDPAPDPEQLRAQAARYRLLRQIITDEQARDALDQMARKLTERADRLGSGDNQQEQRG